MPDLKTNKERAKEMFNKAKELRPDDKDLEKIGEILDILDTMEGIFGIDTNCEECEHKEECSNANNEASNDEPLYIKLEAKETSNNFLGMGIDCHTEIRSNGKPMLQVLQTLIAETMKSLPLDEDDLKAFFYNVIQETIERRNK